MYSNSVCMFLVLLSNLTEQSNDYIFSFWEVRLSFQENGARAIFRGRRMSINYKSNCSSRAADVQRSLRSKLPQCFTRLLSQSFDGCSNPSEHLETNQYQWEDVSKTRTMCPCFPVDRIVLCPVR